jgi:hypothetical protein
MTEQGMDERVPQEGPDDLPPAEPRDEGSSSEDPDDEEDEQVNDAERSLGNRLGTFGPGRSG